MVLYIEMIYNMTTTMMMMVSSSYLGCQIPGTNEPRVEQAPNNNIDGRNLEAFDWDGFSNDGIVGSAYLRNRSLIPNGDGGIHDIQLLGDYDDVCSGNDESDNNVRNGNDEDCNNNVQNGNNDDAPDNAVVGGDVEIAVQGQQNDIPRQLKEVLVQKGQKSIFQND